MSYCTPADVKVYVGTVVSDADLTAMIADSDRDILAFFTTRGISVDTNTAKSASILYTRASVAERFYLTGENPTSYSAGDYSQSGAADQMGLSEKLRAAALKILNDYINDTAASYDSVTDVRRCDAFMDNFSLDQSSEEVFFTEIP